MTENASHSEFAFSIEDVEDWESLKRELNAAFPLSRWQRIRRWLRSTVSA